MFKRRWKLLFSIILLIALIIESIGLAVLLDLKIPTPVTFARKDIVRLDPELRLFDLDWLPPQVRIAEWSREIKYRRTDFLLTSNEKIQMVKLPTNWRWHESTKRDDLYLYAIETNDIPDGKHTYPIKLKDNADNNIDLQVKITAKAGRPAAPYWDKAKFTADGDSLFARVNKKYRLPSTYAPTDLVNLSDYGVRVYNAARVRKAAAKELQKMAKAIAAARIDYKVTSGYRSYDSQVSVYNYWLGLTRGNVAYTDTFSARPGHSEHQLGTTVDFLTNESGDTFNGFENTKLAKWLATNAHKYGFVLSYPKGKTDITGYSFEPWHYRFLGVKSAAEYMKAKVTLTEWLEAMYTKV